MYSIDSLISGGAPQTETTSRRATTTMPDHGDRPQTLPPPPAPDSPDTTPPDAGQWRRPTTTHPHVPNTDVPTRIKPSLNSDNDAPRQPTSQNGVCKPSDGGAGEAHSIDHDSNNLNINSDKHASFQTPHDNGENKSNSCANQPEETAPPVPPAPPLTSAAASDCNHFPGASGGYVLNVPQFNLQAGAPTKGSRELLAVRRTRSKLDLAAKRRRCQRELRAMKAAKRAEPHADGGGREAPRSRITFEYGLKIHGYSSESNSSDELSSDVDSEREFDVWIRSGPPLKLSLAGGKAEFLGFFGLTTHYRRSELELEKLERRKWAPSRLIACEDDAEPESADRLKLPVPFRSPATLNKTPDFYQKAGFLRGMGLHTVNTTQRQEHERNWLKVVRQRLKRKSLTPLNDFYESFAEKMLAIKEKDDVILSIPKFRDSCMQTEFRASTSGSKSHARVPSANLTDAANATITTVTSVLRTIPHATIYSKNPGNLLTGSALDESKEIMNGVVLKQPQYEVLFDENLMHGIVPPEINQEAQMASARQAFDAPETINAVPSTSATILSDGGLASEAADVDNVVQDKRKERKSRAQKHPDWVHWPSLNEMLAVHFKYAKERKIQIKSLQKRLESQKRSIERKQFAVKYYECRHSELRKASTTCNLKRHNMERAIDRLTKIVAAFTAPDR